MLFRLQSIRRCRYKQMITEQTETWDFWKGKFENLERETRFELATLTMARLCSTNWAIPALHLRISLSTNGAGNEVRTRDPNHGKVMLYQLSYSRISWNRFFFDIGAGNEVRTRDPNHGKVMLYQLSYSRIRCWALYRYSLRDQVVLQKLSIKTTKRYNYSFAIE